MGKATVVGLLLFAASAAEARAFDLQDFYGQAVSAAQSLFRPGKTDRDVIPAPPDLDAKMALVPPHDRSRMPVIAPPQ
jgi:hypothetical protein